ncbi:MAG: helix-turn-helix transcriptional regulator [Hyphomicrobiales bacterium]|nr:helix-turn-helix transcriptional regulator [Hyphomicrobiales bacterium]
MAENLRFETLIVAALIFGLVFTAIEIRRVLGRQKRIEQQLQVASGGFVELLEEHFDEWALTPSERDVALLSIKGLSVADMAQLRNTKDGTIKAQCNAIYRKAGVTGRTQLLSLFIEELLAEGLPPSRKYRA